MRLRGLLTTAALVAGSLALTPVQASATSRPDQPQRTAHVKRVHRVERGVVRLVSADVPDANGGSHDVARPVLQRDDGSWLDLH
jgi:hypothetical protein